MLSPSLEDYLEEIYRFSIQQNTVRVVDIGRRLKVAMPSVTKALRKLKAQDYITYQRYGSIYLTAQGQELGRFLVARNQIIQDFLMMLSVECNVAAEAEAIEHYLSASTIETLERTVFFFKNNPDLHIKLQNFLEDSRAKNAE
jgi:Mn-dependent DtxR family transcriptional regulator